MTLVDPFQVSEFVVREAKAVLATLDPDPLAARHWTDLGRAVGLVCAFNSCAQEPTGIFQGTLRPRYCAAHAIDEVAVHRAADGFPPGALMYHERAAAVALLVRRGFTDAQVADRLAITTRAVARIRATHSIPTAHPEFYHHREDRSA